MFNGTLSRSRLSYRPFRFSSDGTNRIETVTWTESEGTGKLLESFSKLLQIQRLLDTVPLMSLDVFDGDIEGRKDFSNLGRYRKSMTWTGIMIGQGGNSLRISRSQASAPSVFVASPRFITAMTMKEPSKHSFPRCIASIGQVRRYCERSSLQDSCANQPMQRCSRCFVCTM
jgi:hypothetical protein